MLLPAGLEQKEAASGNKTSSYRLWWHPGHGDRPWLALEPAPRWLRDQQGTEWVVSCTTAPALFMKENPARAGRKGRRKLELLITAIVSSPLHRLVGMGGLEITQPHAGGMGGDGRRVLGSIPVSSAWVWRVPVVPGGSQLCEGLSTSSLAHGDPLGVG